MPYTLHPDALDASPPTETAPTYTDEWESPDKKYRMYLVHYVLGGSSVELFERCGEANEYVLVKAIHVSGGEMSKHSAPAPTPETTLSVETCTCCECAYQWPKGQDGSHSCVLNLQAYIAELSAAIHYAECWDTAAYPTLLDALMEIGCTAEHEGDDTNAS